MAGKLVVAVVLLAGLAAVLATPLDDYVNKPDSHYKWFQVVSVFFSFGSPAMRCLSHVQNKTYSGPGYKAYLLNMTSQQWLNSSIVDRTCVYFCFCSLVLAC